MKYKIRKNIMYTMTIKIIICKYIQSTLEYEFRN